MESILAALYRGLLQPEDTIVPPHPEYRPLSRQIGALTEEWRNRLGEETFHELEEYFDLCDSLNRMHVEAAFIHGFRLGANIIIEVMSRRGESVPDATSGVPL
ncbi:MAG: hypothetical protein K0R57_2714 [Paenibacillaceae bacterium]|nr:hypothetical protein [Paenibacillaceae bacterium]